MDKLLELKTETFKSTCQVRQINQECLKKKLDFLNNEIKKMSLHYPKFSNTESSIEYLDEIKKTISKTISKKNFNLKNRRSSKNTIRNIQRINFCRTTSML